MRKWRVLLLLITLLISLNAVSAQPVNRSAVVQVIGEELFFQRSNTDSEILLAVNSIAPFGIGDRIRTGTNGRAFITVTEGNRILLLPNSEYEVSSFEEDDSGTIVFHGHLVGIAVHDFSELENPFSYQLDTETFRVTDAANQFTVWSVPDGLQAVVSASSDVHILTNDEEEHLVSSNMGFAIPFSDEPIMLDSPLHASQVVANSVTCIGTVTTNGSEGLRLRAGAALDYIVVDLLDDGQQVPIVGITANGLWYRLPFQTGFGWTFSNLIEADCTDLQQFPNLVGEAPERINDATEAEIAFLEPFYGIPITNSTFYR